MIGSRGGFFFTIALLLVLDFVRVFSPLRRYDSFWFDFGFLSLPVCLCLTTTTTGPMIYRTTLGENVCKWEGKKSVRQRESEMVMNMEIYVRRIRSSFRWLESERERER